MNKRSNESIAAWCMDAIVLLQASGLTDHLAEVWRDQVTKVAGKSAIYDLASGLAESIIDLSPEEKRIASNTLVKIHGYGPNYFVGPKSKTVRKSLMRGTLRNEDEYRSALEAISDTTIDSGVNEQLSAMIHEYGKNAIEPKS